MKPPPLMCALISASRWAVFTTPSHMPWTYGNVTVTMDMQCECDCIANRIVECVREGKAPVTSPGGLAAQLKCGSRAKRFLAWPEVGSTKNKNIQTLLHYKFLLLV